MLRKVCNYLAVIALSLVVTGNSVFANSEVFKSRAGAKKVIVENNEKFHFYQEFLRSGESHTYSVKVEAGKEVRIRVRAQKSSVALKVETPSGQTMSNEAEKTFEVKLKDEGEYTIELESLFLSQYTMEISTR